MIWQRFSIEVECQNIHDELSFSGGAELLDQLGIDKAVIVDDDWGAALAWHSAGKMCHDLRLR